MSKKIETNLSEEYFQKSKKLQVLKDRKELIDGLPHLYGQNFYKWSREFFDSTNQYTFLAAANQIGKSSIQIRKVIHLATEPSIWPKLWKSRPLTFWYLYPTKELSTIEFHKKWVPEFLPRGKFKDHPVYGWRIEERTKYIHAIHFNSGVSIFFRTYATDVQHLQAGTCWYMACDEELPVELFDELNMRIAATDGYFSMVFTATIGQEFWRRTIEERGRNEKFKGAKKIQVSMYDCLEFEDGSPSHWTLDRIKRIENSCKSEVEIQKRVHGRFIKDSGLKYSGFTRQINVKPPHHLPPGWHIYAGVDIGSGGEQGHPSAIVFVAVSPDYKQGRVFKGWRGDGIQTTASDVVSKFIELKGGLITTGQFYDWSSKDFETISRRMGEPFVPAEKSHEIGEQVINVLFKNEMLAIYDLPELQGLIEELSSLDVKTKKTHATDDFIDALRYCVTKIPWDWSAINAEEKVSSKSSLSYEEIGRRGLTLSEDPDLSIMIDDEMEAWSELYDV